MNTQRLLGKTTEALEVNRKLDAIAAELQGICDKLEYEDNLSLEKVKAIYVNAEHDTNTIVKLFDKYIENVREQIGVHLSTTTYKKYSLCKTRFFEMLQDKYHMQDIALKEMTPALIQDFYIYLITKVGQKNNTAVKTMKTFKTVIIYGMKMGVLHTDPYVGVRLHMDPVNRGFLTEEEIDALMRKEFDLPRLELVRDIFVFSCFTGLAYIDVKELKPENIVTLNGVEWIMSMRVKTTTPINVVLFEGAKRIMQKYTNDPRCKGHIFPVMSNQKMNQYLKEIATACGIKKDITFHMARHTFATLTLSKGVPVESVSRMLGHTNIKTTQIYAKITNKKIEEDMTKFFTNKDIINFNAESIKMTEGNKKE